MTLYSFKGAYPTQLPNRIKLANGLTKTDKTTFTQKDLNDAGWVAVDTPPSVDYPNKLVWNNDTLTWSVREPNEPENALKWQEIRKKCEEMLLATDYKVIKAIETGELVDPVYVAYRQDLRDLYNNANDVDPWTVQYPQIVIPDEEESGYIS